MDSLQYISKICDNLSEQYNRLHPNYRGENFSSGLHYVTVYLRYFGKIRMVGALEQTQGRQIEFIHLHPEKDEETWTSDDVAYRYIGDIVPEHQFSDEMRRYYELANAYTAKYDGPDENPILFRDIIGIPKTIELLEQALEQNKIIDFTYDDRKDYVAENLNFELVNLEDY